MEYRKEIRDKFLANVNLIIDENLANEQFSSEDQSQNTG
jgi:hypothetical protein